MNQCTVCGIKFNSFGDYHEHTMLGHDHKGLESNDRGLRTHSSGRTDLVKTVYPGPMNKAKKDTVVAKGELRLGRQNFYDNGK